MSDPNTIPEVGTHLDGGVLTLRFERPAQRNAMTWPMYEALIATCERADSDESVRVLVLRGAGGRAFVAGTDIRQFRDFETGQDGLDYEDRVTTILERLRAVQVPTVAAVEGDCVGGGLGIACAADLRIATPGSRFGVPIARTLGNCLSAGTLSLLVEQFGRPLTLDLLLTARMLDTREAASVPGFLHAVVDDLDEGIAELTTRLLGHAPLTMWAAKKLLGQTSREDDSTVVRRVYGSDDFHEGVAAFADKRAPVWTGS